MNRPGPKPTRYPVYGEWLSIGELAARLGVSYEAIRLYRSRHRDRDGRPPDLEAVCEHYRAVQAGTIPWTPGRAPKRHRVYAPALLRSAQAPAAPRWNPEDSRGLVAPDGSVKGATAINGRLMTIAEAAEALGVARHVLACHMSRHRCGLARAYHDIENLQARLRTAATALCASGGSAARILRIPARAGRPCRRQWGDCYRAEREILRILQGAKRG